VHTLTATGINRRAGGGATGQDCLQAIAVHRSVVCHATGLHKLSACVGIIIVTVFWPVFTTVPVALPQTSWCRGC
jgi:hypothetical protein